MGGIFTWLNHWTEKSWTQRFMEEPMANPTYSYPMDLVSMLCVALICHCWGGSEFPGAQVLFENHSCNTLTLPPRDGCEESIVHTGTWSIVQRKPHIHNENLVLILNYISSASSFNHPSELQLTCLDLHEIDFQSPELRHWTYLRPSRLFQAALSAANHFCTTVWSEVPRWTRSRWVRISWKVSQGGKNQRCGRSKKSNTLHQPNLT